MNLIVLSLRIKATIVIGYYYSRFVSYCERVNLVYNNKTIWYRGSLSLKI